MKRVLPSLAHSRPRRLALRLTTALEDTDTFLSEYPFFSHVTHLEITIEDGTIAEWGWLLRLPALTHLAFAHMILPRWQMIPIFAHLLAHIPKLEVLLCLVKTPLRQWEEIPIDHPRFVILSEPAERFTDFERQAKGERNIWTKAEEVVMTNSIKRERSRVVGPPLNMVMETSAP